MFPFWWGEGVAWGGIGFALYFETIILTLRNTWCWCTSRHLFPTPYSVISHSWLEIKVRVFTPHKWANHTPGFQKFGNSTHEKQASPQMCIFYIVPANILSILPLKNPAHPSYPQLGIIFWVLLLLPQPNGHNCLPCDSRYFILDQQDSKILDNMALGVRHAWVYFLPCHLLAERSWLGDNLNSTRAGTWMRHISKSVLASNTESSTQRALALCLFSLPSHTTLEKSW